MNLPHLLRPLPLVALLATAVFADPTTLKISHQFPGGTVDQGDFRDRLCRKFAAEVEQRTAGALKFEIYPNSSLLKVNAQYNALRKGALDLALIPLPYASGEIPELNISLMPGLVTNYAQASRWKDAAVGRELAAVMAEKGVVIISWVWQAGGVASRGKPIVSPEDAKGLKIRGGSKEMDLVLKAAGAAVLGIPSNEIYQAMQTGAIDAAITSSTSLISFRLEEVSKALSSGGEHTYWFMLEPLMMSKAVFESLTPAQREIILAVGVEMEKFGLQGAQADDTLVSKIFAKSGARVATLDAAAVAKWRAIAKDTAWSDYAARSPRCAQLMTLAQQVP
ncbi:MAG: TRAP transporter substrate-binding protein DctP [Opitutales bacterium]